MRPSRVARLRHLTSLTAIGERRSALALLKKRDALLRPLAAAMADAAERVKTCDVCGSLDTVNPCAVCADPARDGALLCVVEDVGALWALERGGSYRGRYHVLGGLLSALDGRGPEALRAAELVSRAAGDGVREVILALPATVDGQTTAHYLTERLSVSGLPVTSLARGVPVGGELDWLDDGTIAQALRARRPL